MKEFLAKIWKDEEVYTEYKPTNLYKFAAKITSCSRSLIMQQV